MNRFHGYVDQYAKNLRTKIQKKSILFNTSLKELVKIIKATNKNKT